MKETHHFSWVRDKAGPHIGSVTMKNHSALHACLYLQEKYRNTVLVRFTVYWRGPGVENTGIQKQGEKNRVLFHVFYSSGFFYL